MANIMKLCQYLDIVVYRKNVSAKYILRWYLTIALVSCQQFSKENFVCTKQSFAL